MIASDWTGGVRRLMRSTVSDLDQLKDRALDRHVRLAVTGLSRSGKTVFITSMVHHLLDGRGLPFLSAAHEGRLLGARAIERRDGERFPYEAFHAQLASAEPVWPKATETLSRIELEIRFRTRNPLIRQVTAIQSLNLEIIDYPGEWLLDLPLMDVSFEDFSHGVMERSGKGERAALARPWLDQLRQVDLDARADERVARELSRSYTRYLERCRQELGLSLVQPGRFTNPGDMAGSPMLEFCPLPPGEAQTGSLRWLMATRFDDYRESVIKRFYEDHFSRFDRQVVLVDLLTSLNRGPEHFADTQDALGIILESFRYGSRSLLTRLFAPRIDRVLFVGSKADHVAPSQHAALKMLLERLVEPIMRPAKLQGLRPEVLALASLRATDVVRTEHHGQQLSCVRGRLKDDTRETVLYPGEVPPDPPDASDWSPEAFRFRDFAPRRLREGREGQHIRLDQALEFLLGDKLR